MTRHVLAALAALTAVAAATPSQAADRVRRECDASGVADISMSARWEKRGDRRKFSTEFEAAPGGAFSEGDRIVIRVEGVNVGGVRLETVLGGDLVGDLNLDTRPQEDAKPFPSDFPAVGRGARVEVLRRGEAVLSCKLR
ncbi:hypothetical protein [Hansschlegelia zhihuaiae]|uniref:DUF5666 domain-containing protein n=1 Tax=Hansschlegelia zhihuaiae TaxID=405005 RepID=A0A4Q0MKK5_9HYPH|nr:hypothetical protein [Hansschlegelia zhihuaiae]RXF73546.1 hypothetical protein EK403_10165 [Hansschlegelia zhihuaiae]